MVVDRSMLRVSRVGCRCMGGFFGGCLSLGGGGCVGVKVLLLWVWCVGVLVIGGCMEGVVFLCMCCDVFMMMGWCDD